MNGKSCLIPIAKDPSFLHADSKDSDQTGWMPRLIWVFAGSTATLLVLSCHGSFEISSLERICLFYFSKTVQCVSQILVNCTYTPYNPDHMHMVWLTKWSRTHMDRVKRIWYLSPMHPRSLARTSAARPIQAVSQEEPSDRKPGPLPLWMPGHAQLKFIMTECSKTQIHLTGLIYGISLLWRLCNVDYFLNKTSCTHIYILTWTINTIQPVAWFFSSVNTSSIRRNVVPI